jgi:hypothetical protein
MTTLAAYSTSLSITPRYNNKGISLRDKKTLQMIMITFNRFVAITSRYIYVPIAQCAMETEFSYSSYVESTDYELFIMYVCTY